MPREIDEITLTAYALGELGGAENAAERAALEARLAGDELARRQIEEIRATAQLISAELAAETPPGLSLIHHAAIERKLERVSGGDEFPASIPLRPIRKNWAFWGSLAASVAIVCTVMGTVLPRLYHIRSSGYGDGSSSLHTPATGIAPFIVESPETPSIASTDPVKPVGHSIESDAGGFPDAVPPLVWGEIGFVSVANTPLSSVPTLSAYPDAAATLVSIAKSLNNHQLPPVEALRTDKIINALPYHYAVPTTDEAIGATIEVAGCPWDASHRLLRIGLRTMDAAAQTKPSSLPSTPHTGIVGLMMQIEFNPVTAGAYRLIGYETGGSSGDLGDRSTDLRPGSFTETGRSVTVLYEVIPAGSIGSSAAPPVPPLKYQKLAPVAEVSRELATVSIRYRDPASSPPRLREFAVTDDGRTFAAASEDFRTAAAAAAFGLVLRNSAYKGAANYDLVIDLLSPSKGNEVSTERACLLELVTKASVIAGGRTAPPLSQ